MERLACGLVDLKFDAGEVDAMTFSGYGAVFGNVDAYGDVIKPGAFADTLAASKASGNWPVMLMQHGAFGLTAEDLMPIGVWTQLAEDGRGLTVEGKLAPTDRGREAYALMTMQPRPAINGLSIAYRAKEFTLGTKPNEPRRTLKKLDLVEVSLVTFPANPKARVGNVKAFDAFERLADAEAYLRESGMSRAESCAFIAHIKRLGSQSDSDEAAVKQIGELEALARRNIQFLGV